MARIFLVGFMGSGKSTLGKELAKVLDFTFVETDSWIEQMENKSISQIFADHGETYFRKLETQLLKHLQLLDDCIIATGGGMPCYENNIEVMNELGTTIWLDVEENVLVERVEMEKDTRPLLSKENDLKKKIQELLETRRPFYMQAKYQIKDPALIEILEIVNQK